MKLLQIILFCLFSTYAVGQVNVVGNCHVAGDPNIISALDVMDSFSECAIVYDTVNHIVYKYVEGGTPIWQEIKADGAAIETNTVPSGGKAGDMAVHTNLGQFYIHDGTAYNTQGFPDGDFAKTASLTTNADLTPNLSTGLRYTWSINGNYNLQNPTFGSIGRKGVIAVTNTAGTASTITTIGGNYVDENYATVSTIVIPASATKYFTFRQATDSGGPVVMLENVTINNPTMGGDLSGTASNAQIVANAVGPNEIATGGVELNTGDVTGTLPVTKGGTGLTALGSALQVLRVNGAGTALEYAAASGTISGSGTSDFIPRWTGSTSLGNSGILHHSASGIRFGNSSGPNMWSFSTNGLINDPSGTNLAIFHNTTSQDASNGALYLRGPSMTQTSGKHYQVRQQSFFYPTSGTAAHVILGVGGTINQTGGANGDVTFLEISGNLLSTGGNVLGINQSTGSNKFRGMSGFGGSLNTTLPAAQLQIFGGINNIISANAWGLNGISFRSDAQIGQDASTSASGTATNAVFHSFAAPSLLATNASVTTTNAANVYIAGAPTASTNQTITNAYSLWVDAGDARLDGNLSVAKSSAPAEALDVTGNIRTSGQYQIGGTANYMNSPTTNTIALFTNSAERLRVNASGNVGIGTSTQVNRLDVEGALAVGVNYSGTTVAPTNGAIIEGSTGIGVNSVVASSILDIGGTTKGSRPFPSLTTTQRDDIATPATGLFAYNTTTNRLEFYNGSAWGGVNSNLFSGALTNTAFVSHTDNFGFEMTGTGAKRLYTTNGTYNNSLIVNSTGSFLSSTDGTNTSNINILANGNAVINSSTGNYLMSTAPQKDSDVAGDLQVRDASGFLKAVDREAFEILTGSGAPVNGTTTAYEVGQIYIDVTNAANPISYYASVKSTDPDAAATGSVWNRLTNSTTLSDADGDTKVQVEESTDEDIIRFDAGGNEVALFYDNRIDFLRRPLITGAGAINNKSAAQLTITNSSNTQYATFFVDDANGDLSIYTNGTTTPQLLIESAGTGIGINTTNADASAALDITSTTQGVLFPRMTTTQRDAITTPAAGLVIFNTTTDKLQVRTSSAWVDLH